MGSNPSAGTRISRKVNGNENAEVVCDDGSMARPLKTSDADDVLCYCLQSTVDVEGRIAPKAI